MDKLIKLNRKQIDEFKRIWKEKFGEEISDDFAIEHGTKMIELIRMLLESKYKREHGGIIEDEG